jgi:hypothetical protein
VTVHLVCTCGAETWTWSAWTPDPIAEAFKRQHAGQGHHATQRRQRRQEVASP